MISKLFVLLNDLTNDVSGDIVEKIGVESEVAYEKRPEKCPKCEAEAIAGVEILGAYKKSLIWQCMKCGDRFLKLSRTTTLKLLEDATSAWTNPNDWGDKDDKELN